MPKSAVARRVPAVALLTLVALALTAAPVLARHPAIERAEKAIARGHVDPQRDLGPILYALKRGGPPEEMRELVGAIGDLGERDGESPNAVKAYLLEEAPPLLLDVVRNGHDTFLQIDAMAALRDLGAPRSVLEEAAKIAESDPDEAVRARAEIMRNYMKGMPVENESAVSRPVATDASRAAIAYLDKLGVGVSTDALRDAARDGTPEVVKALLDAGVAPDTGVTTLNDTPLYMATEYACANQESEAEWVVDTIRHLVKAGATLTFKDDNSNTVLISAARNCGKQTVALLLDAGAKIGDRNGSGLTALGFALLGDKLDVAEVLVAHGAKLNKTERAMVEPSVKDAKGKALIKKASV
jgi:ankyrin repeat protein